MGNNEIRRAGQRSATRHAREIANTPAARLTLDEILAVCDPDAPESAFDRAWLADKPVGREII